MNKSINTNIATKLGKKLVILKDPLTPIADLYSDFVTDWEIHLNKTKLFRDENSRPAMKRPVSFPKKTASNSPLKNTNQISDYWIS